MIQQKFLKGFSVIELMLVLSVIMVIGTFGTVFFSRLISQNAVANTQDQILGEIRKAQLYSMMGKQNGSWGVNYSSNTITLFQGNSFATRNNAFDEKFTINSNINIGGFTEIIFAKTTGLPTPNTISGTISGNSSNKTFTVNAYGVTSR